MPDPHLAYRADIDGLRAVAVSSVIAAHAFPASLPGGFIGVDIFFVISGYLITAILQREIADSSFSVGAFYGRRIRRLFPALAIVLGACLVAGYTLLLEEEYRQLGWHVAAGSGFFANIALWAEAGYFNRESELKPLLHLWSLGVEEQFYLLWPLLLALALKIRARLGLFVTGLTLLSFGINLASAQSQPTAAFFLPFARFWELLLGAALAIFQHHRRPSTTTPDGRHRYLAASETCALAGLSLIALALFLLGPDKVFPGWWALLPAIGTTLLIGAGPDTRIARQVMAARPLVWLGLISYPLYLWHWPLLSFARTLLAEAPPPSLRIALTAIALLLATAAYRLVELPLRKAGRSREVRRRTTVLLVEALAVLMLAGRNSAFPASVCTGSAMKSAPLDGTGSIQATSEQHAMVREASRSCSSATATSSNCIRASPNSTGRRSRPVARASTHRVAAHRYRPSLAARTAIAPPFSNAAWN